MKYEIEVEETIIQRKTQVVDVEFPFYYSIIGDNEQSQREEIYGRIINNRANDKFYKVEIKKTFIGNGEQPWMITTSVILLPWFIFILNKCHNKSNWHTIYSGDFNAAFRRFLSYNELESAHHD